MRNSILLALVIATLPMTVVAQRRKKKNEDDFLHEKPGNWWQLPDIVVYDPNGKEISTESSFRVITRCSHRAAFTLLPFLWNVSGLEAVYRDYAPKGVKFYFVYKWLGAS